MSDSDEGVRIQRFEHAGGAYVVIGIPQSADMDTLDLSAAERDICMRVLAGASNREIAVARGTSTSTVANQLRRLYQRLGVTNRAELCLKLTDGVDPPE